MKYDCRNSEFKIYCNLLFYAISNIYGGIFCSCMQKKFSHAIYLCQHETFLCEQLCWNATYVKSHVNINISYIDIIILHVYCLCHHTKHIRIYNIHFCIKLKKLDSKLYTPSSWYTSAPPPYMQNKLCQHAT